MRKFRRTTSLPRSASRRALSGSARISRHAAAQSEEQLRAFFEGRTVRIKLDMPGSQEGVDVWPARPQPIDFPRYATKLKQLLG